MSIRLIVRPSTLVDPLVILVIDKQVTLTRSLTIFEVSVIDNIIIIEVPGSFTVRQVVMELALIVWLAKLVIAIEFNIAFVTKDFHTCKFFVSLSSFTFFHSFDKLSFVWFQIANFL